jgi:lipid II:glycine glycyltransferase (peptidoglycan interpeptide bridge formation enzyme)
LQLELFLNSDIVKVENSQVKIDDVVIAHLDNIGFAAGNDKYKSLREELEQLETRIAKTRKRLEKCPDDEDFQDDLNEYLKQNFEIFDVRK